MTVFKASLAAAGLAAAVVSVFAVAADPAEARSCRARISGEGTGTGLAGLGTKNARAAALNDWAGKAQARYGRRYASTRKASGMRYDCRSGFVLQVKCVVTARPCR